MDDEISQNEGLPWCLVTCMFYPVIAVVMYVMLRTCGRIPGLWSRLKTFVFLLKCLWKQTSTVATDKQGPMMARIEGSYIVIPYVFNGKEYNAYMPYCRKYLMQTSGAKVGLSKGKEYIDITQMPGVGYVMSAVDMGGDMFICRVKGVDHIRRTPPGFLETIH